MGRDARSNPRGRFGGPALFGAGGGRIVTESPQVLDAYGRPLQEGDIIHLQTPINQPFRVQSVRPVVEPGLPAGLMEITVQCVARFHAPRMQRAQEFVLVLTKEEAGQGPSATDVAEHRSEPPARAGDPAINPDGDITTNDKAQEPDA